MYHGSVSQTTFRQGRDFSVRYNGDYIEAAAYTDLGWDSLDDFMFALDANLKEARENAIQCYISIEGDDQ